jgi:hypothetical protein
LDSRLPKMLFVLLAVIAPVCFWSTNAKLPDVIVSHFDARGVANGRQPKFLFLAFFAGSVAIAAFLTFGIPAFFSKMPTVIINLPNKEYWLAPERRAETLAFLNGNFAWFSCAALLPAAIAVNIAIGRNLHPQAQSDSVLFSYVFAGFLGFAASSSIRMLTRFSHLPPSGFTQK